MKKLFLIAMALCLLFSSVQASAGTLKWKVADSGTETEQPTAILFGRYEQDNDLSNGPEPIEWIVLAAEADARLVISKYGLIAMPYNSGDEEATWETCTLRSWLNGNFYSEAFNAQEQERILESDVENADNEEFHTEGGNDTTDRVFLLSIDEMNRYLPVQEDRPTKPTDYARAKGAHVNTDNGNCWWWLRSPGKDQGYAAVVNTEGFSGGSYSDLDVKYMGEDVNTTDDSVRPVMWMFPAEDDAYMPGNESEDVHKDEPMDEPMDESAPEPTQEPAGDLKEELSDLLLELEQSEEDPWRLAVYEAGAEDVSYNGESLRFFLRSFNPGLESLGDYEADRGAYLDGLIENACAYDLEVILTLVDGEISADNEEALKSAVSEAAAASKSAFDQKAVRVAIANWMFPKPAENVKKAADMLNTSDAFEQHFMKYEETYYEESDFLAPLFYAQKKQTLDVSGGPHALVMRCVGVNPEALAEPARAKALADLARMAHANIMESDEVREIYLQKLAEIAFGAAGEAFELVLDIDDFEMRYPGDDYDEYLSRYLPSDAFGQLEDEVWNLPDYPALDFPKTGRLSGSTSGTKVIVKAPDDGYGRYIQLRNYETDEVAVTFFIRSGGSCSVRVRSGDYYFLIAAGEIWYGEEELFGYDGNYSSTDLLEVAGSNYYHTVTLETTTDGNMSVYGADPSSFLD